MPSLPAPETESPESPDLVMMDASPKSPAIIEYNPTLMENINQVDNIFRTISLTPGGVAINFIQNLHEVPRLGIFFMGNFCTLLNFYLMFGIIKWFSLSFGFTKEK